MISEGRSTSANSFHHDLRPLQVDALVASSAYHAWRTSGKLALNWSMSGVMARIYMAIDRKSSYVVPSVEEISPLPDMNSLTRAV